MKAFRPPWYQFYRQQRGNAKLRGIEFNLSPEEWWDIWCKSGKFLERGKGPDKYCMARYGDVGPYAVGNVKIITNYENNFVGSSGRKHSLETRKKMSEIHKGRAYCPHKLSPVQKDEAIRLYLDSYRFRSIAAKFGVSNLTIRRLVKKRNVFRKRHKWETRDLKDQQWTGGKELIR